MAIALVRSLWFALAVLLIVAVWEVLTFELPREPISNAWSQRLFIHLLLAGAISGGALLGSFLSFHFLPVAGLLPTIRLLALGATFALVTFFLIAPIAKLGGFVIAFVSSTILAAVLVQTVGRLLAQNGV
jgi:hypothetical protein